MSQQEDGWPLGLQLLNMRIGLIGNRDFSGSISFNTIVTGSSSSSDFSSDLDTESTGSFFHDKSITLGNLIGVSNVAEGRRRLASFRRGERNSNPKKQKSKTWFSLCARSQIDGEDAGNPPSLGHFLEVERRAANFQKRDRNSLSFVLDEFPGSPALLRANSLFSNGRIAAPRRMDDSQFGSDGRDGSTRAAIHPDGCVVPMLFSCVCGLSSH